ncbi:MAG: nicotinate (nicotinamide) nucleotide adenylyltransferase [Actinobacteria bacterium]|nr:nicotinate (nicotinamide) nucleotide adenylyltransferase [Actinomycetota bacterium]
MIRIGILGGTFDPIHLGHHQIIKKLADRFDQIMIIPAGKPMLRQEVPTATAADRLEMCALSLNDLPDALQEKVVLLDIEIKREGSSFTVDTLGQLKAFFPHDSFTIIIGSDAALNFDKWKRAADIKRGAEILVVKRPGSEKSAFPEIEINALEISATDIRALLQAKKEISSVLSPSVAKYINERGLYASK